MPEKLTSEEIRAFQHTVYSYYRTNPRTFPWRETRDPYRILISEIMLQQTQTERVVEKYERFIKEFSDFPSLAKATPGSLLPVWQGLGYNRRALALIRIAQAVMENFQGILPSSPEMLKSLPGIGKATAGEIAAFAFDYPSVFIETNIRRVFIHFFFPEQEKVRDNEIFPLVEKTLDRENPRIWYYALMDYGVMLKKRFPNPNIKSAHYQRQSPFHGSNREVRGKILRILIRDEGLSASEIAGETGLDKEKVMKNLVQLEKEGFLGTKGEKYFITLCRAIR
jgi:A/G-specific adenine glycosylase